MSERAIPYGTAVTVHQPYAQAVQAARAALAAEGFGILCEIDLAATLHARLGVAVAPYVILGACNPPLAHRALAADPEIGLLLPCNVVVRAGEAPGTSVVAALDPEAVLGLAGRETLAPIAREVAERLRHVLAAVAAAAPAAAPDETVEATEEIC